MMEKQEFLAKYGLTEDQFCGKKEIKGYLDLGSLTSIPEGFNPTVGGNLYLENLTSIPEGFNPTVGGYLELRNVTSIPEGLNPTVGGNLYLGSLTSNYSFTKINADAYLFIWQNGKYISVDGIFCEVILKKKNVFKCKKINQNDEFYIVGDGNGKFAHGKTVKEAKSDLVYKISNRDTSKYSNLTKDSIITFEEAIECYRIVTGACVFGTKSFVEGCLKDVKKTYSIQEIGMLTKGQYGNGTFMSFFNL